MADIFDITDEEIVKLLSSIYDGKNRALFQAIGFNVDIAFIPQEQCFLLRWSKFPMDEVSIGEIDNELFHGRFHPINTEIRTMWTSTWSGQEPYTISNKKTQIDWEKTKDSFRILLGQLKEQLSNQNNDIPLA